ncbi:hypothetical protein D6D01_02216 [Aureobasidium pullulans]|uniref:Uncharacterized protein n=1 Tax=Aureobasidium pullulans TaxID=5580 RepID=A0A4S9LUW5_AURPU|nr:hypothetical protein D6D01_02216 [Aureobasidium pullulans]
MASNGPYYQPVQAHDQPVSDEMRLAQGILDYTASAPQASMYPEPNSEYHHAQQLASEQEAEDHAQLQGLVEAATSAAAQEQIRQRNQQLQFAHSDQDLASLLRDPSARLSTSRRKRSNSLDNDDQTSASESSKRQRRSEDDGHHSPHLDARAAGVHSAAALFRPASDSSKKYTRPPMSKLFTSLELSPENFLYLQAAAKQYMLNANYPDRQACVGNRGRGDNEMVKARMYQCVREFLEAEGWGEKYFGENAPPPNDGEANAPPQPRRYVWPRDRDRIIALCTPLLRRMVTNERQRQYAIESRKGGKPDKIPQDASDPQAQSAYDQDSVSMSAHDAQAESYDSRLDAIPAYHLYLVTPETGQLVRDRISFTMEEEFSWQWLVDTLVSNWCSALQIVQPPPDIAANILERFTIKVLTSSGLTTVSGEGEWQLAIQDIRQTIWLDSTVKVVAECPSTP